ncbi:Hypothetical predicted protein [Mytilus galloprovincialis]|uniref:Uncharacterized protein n=1 Tax=Mytilus galloprovincialis TaxID=29158 RepID=A0A8B6FRT4_MYTGA|nr:Hypothetical predicted protein [Mytilus galloprovincialis]
MPFTENLLSNICECCNQNILTEEIILFTISGSTKEKNKWLQVLSHHLPLA